MDIEVDYHDSTSVAQDRKIDPVVPDHRTRYNWFYRARYD